MTHTKLTERQRQLIYQAVKQHRFTTEEWQELHSLMREVESDPYKELDIVQRPQ